MKKRGSGFSYSVLCLGLLLALYFAQPASAQEPCTASWYCSQWSADACGMRSCFDANACGSAETKPEEYSPCATDASSPRFIMSDYMLMLDVIRGVEATASVRVESFSDNLYTARLTLPESLSGHNSSFRLSEQEFFLDAGAETRVRLAVDSDDLPVGAHVLALHVNNSQRRKAVLFVLNVNHASNVADFTLRSPPSVFIDEASSFDATIHARGLVGDEADIAFSVISRDGVAVLEQESGLDAKDLRLSYTETLGLPQGTLPGYYVLNAVMRTPLSERSKVAAFTVIDRSAYRKIDGPASFGGDASSALKLLIAGLFFAGIIAAYIVMTNRPPDGTETRPAPKWHLFRSRVLDAAVPADKAFGLIDGQTLYSLRELLDALPYLDDASWEHHTMQGRNDFASWVRHVMNDEELASRVGACRTREELIALLRSL